MERDTDVLLSFHPAVRDWFTHTFPAPTASQRLAFPPIKRGETILLLSPTGSGKTLAGFLGAIDHLVHLSEKNELENTVYVIYVSPLRALSNDIRKNLLSPLEGIRHYAPFADIRVLVRTGDTSAYRRSKMLEKTPHILITTPETLQIILNAPRFREKLTTVKYVIVDEIHDLCDTKRGVSLSLSLERLQHLAGPFVRVGLSATQAPVEEIAQFLGGTNRPVRILIAEKEKRYDLNVVKPPSLPSLSLERAVEETYDILKDLIESHNITLIFSNTRSRTERIVYQLKRRGVFSVEAHHGSMGKETRHTIEHLLKEGLIKSVVTSTSLELGIDIGDVDLVVQLGSPRQTAKLMQRIGRAGHGFNAISQGVLIAQDRDELVELEILKRKALSYNLEPVRIPQNCLDVLAQHLVGMSLEKVWHAEDAFRLVRQSYNFRTLSFTDFISVLEYLGGYYADLEEKHIYRKLWFDGNQFGKLKPTRYLYFSNCGTIPSEAIFYVVLNGIPVGTLSEHFVSHLKPKDVFILGGKSLEFVRVENMRVLVRDALGGEPTVPSWRGEALSRPYDFAHDITAFRREVEKEMEKREEERTIDPDILAYCEEQKRVTGFIPTEDTLYVERYIDGKGVYHLIFHSPFGRAVNETLARAYSYRLGCTDFTVTDNGFMLTASHPLHPPKEIVSSELVDIIKATIWGTELFYQRFRHCAQRGFLILKTYRGTPVSPRTQYFKARSLLKELPFDFPIVKETFNEVLYSALDCTHAQEVLERIERGEITIVVSDYTSIPSPFALSILLAGAQDVITLKDRSEFLQHMQRAVTERIIEANPVFDTDLLDNYFRKRERTVTEGPARDVVLDMLRCGIKTAQEIAAELAMTKEETERVLDSLIEENLVSCGYFTLPELQYMLVKDRRYLEYGEGIEDEVVKRFLFEKHFTFKDARDVVSTYGAIRSKRAIYDRVGFFSLPLLRVKVGGRMVSILPEDAPLFAAAYRGELPQKDAETLAYLQEHPGLKRKEIVEACGRDVSRLEETLSVYRDEENRFYVLDVALCAKEEAQREIVRRYVASCGPVSKGEIIYHTKFQKEDIEKILDNFKKITVFSKVVQEMYVTPEDYETLKNYNYNPQEGAVRIIDRTDPFYDKVQYAPGCDEPFSPVVVQGKVVGGVLCEGNEEFSVEALTLTEAVPPQALLREVERVYHYYRWHGARKVVLVPEEMREMVEKAGYEVEDGVLIDAPPFVVSEEELLITQMDRQHLLEPKPFKDVLALPFLDAESAQKRTTDDFHTLIKKGEVVEVSYKSGKYVCLPEDREIYEGNDVKELVARLLHSFLLLSPFQVRHLVDADIPQIEQALSSISEKVSCHGEPYYLLKEAFTPKDALFIHFLPVTDPYVVIHNEKWLLEGTAILVNGKPAGYYTLDNGLADLTLSKEYKDLWGTILVKLPSENIAIRTINGRLVKDTRFSRAFA